MDNTGTSEVSAAGESASATRERIELDPNGDAILVVKNETANTQKEFRVSTATLALASEYFKTLFRSDFREGRETLRGDCPEIILQDSDPEVMQTILSILHFKDLDRHVEPPSPQRLAAIAVHADQYRCAPALLPYCLGWFNFEIMDLYPTFPYRLAAAYFLRAKEKWDHARWMYMSYTQPDAGQLWTEHEVLRLVPDNVRGLFSFCVVTWVGELGAVGSR